jgi:DNA-binding NtrC family response regulator
MNGTREPLIRIKELLQTREFQQVLSLTEAVGPDGSLAQAEAFVYRTEAMIALGDFAPRYIDVALHTLRHQGDSSLFALAKYLKARISIVAGDLLGAQESLAEAYMHYKRHDDQRGMGSCSLLQSYAAYQQADYGKFFEYAERCLHHYSPEQHPQQIGMVLLNIALARLRLGQLTKSQETLSDILVKYLPKLREDTRYNYCFVQALLHTQRGQSALAYEVLEKSGRPPAALKRESFLYAEISLYVNLRAGRYREADEWFAEGKALAADIGPGSTYVSQILRLRADCSLVVERYNDAFTAADEALAIAEALNERVEIAACWRVFAQVAVHEQKQNDARDWFRKAIDLFNQISSRYELAVTRYLAACSGVFEQTESLALLYLAKEYFESEQVVPYIQKVTSALQSIQRTTVTQHPVKPSRGDSPVQIITGNKVMLSVLELARNLAPSGMTVLLTGETGTGKDLLARYLYEHSGCAGQFVSQNVTTLPISMIESELFGHRKGAFTGADRDRPGLIKQAEHGVLFLNEIGVASAELQAKLLEVLETRRVRRVGEDKDQSISFRLITATNADLTQCVRSGKFRADLFHRLNQATLTLPPLRERFDDIALLAKHFLASLGANNDDDAELNAFAVVLAGYDWPGNVRELEHTVRRLWVIHSGNLNRMTKAAASELAEMSEDQLTSVLAECGGNQRKAARLLGIGESTLRYRMKKRSE